MSDYAEFQRRHWRLAILRHLEGCAGYTANPSILRDVLTGLGFPISHAQMRTECAWLVEQGLIRPAAFDRPYTPIEATEAGVDVARGLSRHPDIARPEPRR